MAALQSEIVGVDIGQSHVTAVRLVARAGAIHPIVIGEVGLPREAISMGGKVESPETLTEALKLLWKTYKPESKRIRVAVPNAALTFQPMNRPGNLSPEEIAESVRLEMQPLLPYPDKETQLAHYVVGQTPSGDLRVLSMATHSEITDLIGRAAGKAGLALDAIEPSAYTLARAADVGRQTTSAEMLLHLGLNSSVVIVIAGGYPQYAQSLSIGGEDFTAELLELGYPDMEAELFKRTNSLVGTQVDDPHQAEREALLNAANQLVESVYEVMTYANADLGLPISRVVLSGGSARLSGLLAHINATLGCPCELVAPRPELHLTDPAAFCRQLPAFSLCLPENLEL